MEKAVKEENISALKLDLVKATSLVLADFRGISVKSDTSLRREFRAKLKHKYSGLSNQELRLCQLLRSGLKSHEAARLMCMFSASTEGDCGRKA